MVQGNVTVGIGVLSYAGQLNFSIRVSAGVVDPAQKQLRMRPRRTLPGFVAQSADDPRR